MPNENWEQVVEIFEQAIEFAPAERSAFLNRVCLNKGFRGEVEAMLAADEKAERFIETPAIAEAPVSFLENKFSALETRSPVGSRIGAYHLTREIGRGGMGTVFSAERADGEFKKRAAVKLIRAGMDSNFIIKRFRQERQILAELNHPNIARLLDGGTTQGGSPYLIMEFVEGDTLLEYSEKNHLTLEERLKLFEQICHAVEYAHRQNVLHRDLKPSNILVAQDGTPKLLDFGIAKLHDGQANGENTELTMTGKWLMTPEYASPEQVRGEPLTPASDVYSLGIILYNLLTGEAPYKFPSRAPHEISRVICEVTPTRPISTIMRQPVNSASSIGKSRTTNKMNRPADELLERIVLKSLCKNPAERYQSAREFAEDIANYLRGEAVSAPDFQIQTIAAEKRLSRWRRIGQGALVILYGILAMTIAIMIDSVTDSLLPYELPAIIFLAFFVAAIRRVVYPIQTKAAEKESQRRAVGQGALLVLYGILTVATVAMIDSALDSLLPYELPAIIFLAFLAAGLRRIVYPKQSVK